tara:strand:+ start:1542 stop:2198 length:657 start_codon:yes stop_codon:yes gene_type:complete
MKYRISKSKFVYQETKANEDHFMTTEPTVQYNSNSLVMTSHVPGICRVFHRRTDDGLKTILKWCSFSNARHKKELRSYIADGKYKPCLYYTTISKEFVETKGKAGGQKYVANIIGVAMQYERIFTALGDKEFAEHCNEFISELLIFYNNTFADKVTNMHNPTISTTHQEFKEAYASALSKNTCAIKRSKWYKNYKEFMQYCNEARFGEINKDLENGSR